MDKTVNILFVCMGNICRSPAAEGVLKAMSKDESSIHLHIESCGIGDWHIGNLPDSRMQEASRERGIVLTSRAQQFKPEFLDKFDYILASDPEVMKYIYHYAKTPEHRAKVVLMTHFSPLHKGEEIPDPYYDPDVAFKIVLDMLEDSCSGLIDHLKSKRQI